jgi:hypothetical protein
MVIVLAWERDIIAVFYPLVVIASKIIQAVE